jgi:hypothetical protein
MLLSGTWHKCECGYGEGWYCRDLPGGFDTLHEFNPDADPEAATGDGYYIRRPPGIIFGHISGRYAEANLCEYGPAETDRVKFKKEKFTYKKYGSRRAAFEAAAKWVFLNVSESLFRPGKVEIK